MDAVERAFSPTQRNSELMKEFGHRLRNQFEGYASYRRPKELEWLEDLRQIKGIYDPEVRIQPGNSKVYPKITRSKITIALARLHEMLFPEREKNWEVTPTPDPKIDKQTVLNLALALVQTSPETGETIYPDRDQVKLAIKKFCDDSCSNMSTTIDDQLIEMGYKEETKLVLKSGLKYGTGVMKGPMIKQRVKRIWEPDGAGDYQEMEEKEEIPYLQFVRLWDWYPDMSVTDIDHMEGAFERHIMTKHDLRLLKNRDDFYSEMIDEYLKNYPNGNYVPATWETELQIIETEAGASSGSAPVRLSYSQINPLSEYDLGSTRPAGKKYELLEFWGYVDGSDLKACGLDVDDVSIEYAANIWMLPGRGDAPSCPIKAVLYPGTMDHYKVFYFEKDETSIFGDGLARLMRHSQIAIAAGSRMVLDNAAVVSGPQVEVNWSLIEPGTDTSAFYPRKIWYRHGRGPDAQYPAIRSLNFDSHIDELIQVVNLFKSLGDEETALPTWLIGQQVNNETAQATSGRMALTLAAVKDVVKNFDEFTEANIRALYSWNMEFNPDTSIKGDFQCKAKGSSSLIMKEIRMQALTQFSAGLTPDERDYIPERDFLKEKLHAHDLYFDLKTEEEVQKIRDERSKSASAQLAMAMAQAEIEYKKAQTLAQTTRARKLNVDAIKAAAEPPEVPQGTSKELQDAEVSLANEKTRGQSLKNTEEELKTRRAEEKHAQEMSHSEDNHALDQAERELRVSEDLSAKREMQKATIEAKKTAAKQRKVGGMKPKKDQNR